ncbi:MAG TPA: DUF6600 domain-containing protein [Geothrix sp.]|nr:DUF6600 domain-containing protein [Geothrix sp.]
MNNSFNPFRCALLLLPAAIISAAPQAPDPAASPAEEESYQGEAPERYAMVRTLEGDVRIHKGDLDESLSRGTPIAEGDVVESRGRGVLQLGDGTRVAFGGATRFTVAALFTDRNGEKQVLLRLDYGRLRVVLGGQGETRFRVDTPSGSATCMDKGAFSIEAERDRLVRLKVHSGRVSFANERDQTRIAAGDRLTVYSPQDSLDRVRGFNTYDGDDFDNWSDRAVMVRRGESWDRVPAEIRYYSDELDRNGRWVDSGEFGWVWQPNGVAEDWRPYYQGRWAPYSGGMTWISDEPWAYVAYHHGRWHWSLGVGWFWIPGVNYSPAWVAWNYTPGYCGWAPLGYYNTPCHWGYGAWGGGYAWNVVNVNYINVVNVNTRIYSDAHVLRSFNGANGATSWSGGRRGLGAPWRTTPLLVSRDEFHNPGQIQTAFQRDVNRDRLASYARQAQAATGRTVIMQDRRVAGPQGGRTAGTPGDTRVPFEPRTRPASAGGDAAPNRNPEPRPMDRGQGMPAGNPRREGATPRERGADARPRTEVTPMDRGDRRPDPRPRETSPEPRPRSEDRLPTPAPRDRGFDAPRGRDAEPAPRPMPRPSFDREERRPAPMPIEREPRPAPRGEPAREARPAPRPEPSRESHSTPAPEPQRNRGRSEERR